MPNRPYKCPLCHSTFKNESGMKWHIAHRHEIPAAFDTLGRDYEAKTVSLQDENIRLKQESDDLEKKLRETTADFIMEKTARLEAEARVQQLAKERDKAILAMVIRGHILEEKLGIRLENPFEECKNS